LIHYNVTAHPSAAWTLQRKVAVMATKKSQAMIP
jgi:hypothetical protein